MGGQVSQLPPLDQLMAPVALYPDPLLSLILPAAAYPDQVQAAASVSDPNQVDSQGLEPSVAGLAHYPDVARWMSDNMDWTQQVGGAFASDPNGVMDAVQDLRRRALDDGTLVSTPQVQVVNENGQIEILPVEVNTVFVPQYDPDAVYFRRAGSIEWGDPLPCGAWLTFAFDWGRHTLWRGDWFDYARSHGGWRGEVDVARGDVRGEIHNAQEWRAPANHPQAPEGLTGSVRGGGNYARVQVAHPQAMHAAAGRAGVEGQYGRASTDERNNRAQEQGRQPAENYQQRYGAAAGEQNRQYRPNAQQQEQQRAQPYSRQENNPGSSEYNRQQNYEQQQQGEQAQPRSREEQRDQRAENRDQQQGEQPPQPQSQAQNYQQQSTRSFGTNGQGQSQSRYQQSHQGYQNANREGQASTGQPQYRSESAHSQGQQLYRPQASQGEQQRAQGRSVETQQKEQGSPRAESRSGEKKSPSSEGP
jgi:hypothetical protein